MLLLFSSAPSAPGGWSVIPPAHTVFPETIFIAGIWVVIPPATGTWS